jgi:hypothetical protein
MPNSAKCASDHADKLAIGAQICVLSAVTWPGAAVLLLASEATADLPKAALIFN